MNNFEYDSRWQRWPLAVIFPVPQTATCPQKTVNTEHVGSHLVYYDKAKQALAQAASVDEVKDIKDKAEAIRLYAQQQKDTALEQYAAQIKTRAMRRIGELSRELDKEKPGPKITAHQREVTPKALALKEAGISTSTAQRCERLAAIPEKVFEQFIERHEPVTNILRQIVKKEKIEAILPSDKYRVIYADPPWSYGNSGIINDDNYGRVGRHYPSMTIKQLCDLPISTITEKDAVLFLWVTSPLLEEAFPVIKAWGFTYKTSFVWNKVKHNMGHYNSVRHEFLLVCTRGSCTPDIDEKIPSVQTIERSKTHSEKPEAFRAIIDRLYPHGKRIELFARKKVNGWDAYGNEPSACSNQQS